MKTQTFGPYDDERDTFADPLPRAVAEATPRRGGATAINRRHLRAACDDAGVQLGEYDTRVLAWLGSWEPAICQVVIGLISRAHAAGVEQGRDGAA